MLQGQKWQLIPRQMDPGIVGTWQFWLRILEKHLPKDPLHSSFCHLICSMGSNQRSISCRTGNIPWTTSRCFVQCKCKPAVMALADRDLDSSLGRKPKKCCLEHWNKPKYTQQKNKQNLTSLPLPFLHQCFFESQTNLLLLISKLFVLLLLHQYFFSPTIFSLSKPKSQGLHLHLQVFSPSFHRLQGLHIAPQGPPQRQGLRGATRHQHPTQVVHGLLRESQAGGLVSGESLERPSGWWWVFPVNGLVSLRERERASARVVKHQV